MDLALSDRERVTTLTRLKQLPRGTVLLSEKHNRRYGGRRLIQVHLTGKLYSCDGSFVSHIERRRGPRWFLPAEIIYMPEEGDHE